MAALFSHWYMVRQRHVAAAGGADNVNPLRLTLQNFLCYRENVPTLDFTGLHVACLSGANGHGKSALLDAITWCLWGEARAKTQDELISYGADEMRVELEFLVRDTRYRAIRSHARGGGRRRQGVTDLQLQVTAGDPGASGWQPITGNSVRETQARIEQVLGLDYDTFINSAFLLQGRADEFTNKTAAERKVVLGKVLGLAAYDQLQERARDRLSEKRESADRLSGGLEAMTRQVDALGDPSPELAGVGLRLKALSEQLQRQGLEAEGLRTRVGELQRQRDDLAALQQRMQVHRQDISQLEAGLRAAQQRTGEYRTIIQQAEAIQRGAAQLHEARRRFQALEQARARFEALRRERESLERVMETRRARLEEGARQLRQRQSELAAQAQGAPALAAQLEAAHGKLAALEAEERAVAGLRERQQSLADGIGEARTTAERYRVEGQELKVKLELLERPSAEGPQEVEAVNPRAVCPLCQTALGADGCQRLAQVYQGEIEDKRRLYRENQATLQRLEAEKTTLEQELRRREQALERTRQSSQRSVLDLERRLDEASRAQDELAQVSERLAAAQGMLESGEFAAQERRQVDELAGQMAALGYDEEARQLSYMQAQELQPFEERQRRLAQAVASLPAEEEALARTQDMLGRRREELAGQESQLRGGQAALAELPQWEARLRQAEQALREAAESQRAALTREALLKEQQRRLEQLRQELAEASGQLKALQDEQAVYRELVTALGRQGVQAMLIETVVPRLEQEANLLLGRMTDNRMHLRLETQRQTVKGATAETLEIKVSDELGPRSYEMYSGGEAFRVNLALRIALSRVLSQRMGAPLPTLFIDEGFGTQDTAGRERIVDVISAIRDEFDKIIVITHLEDLKDQFPDRIEVWKEPSGSTFRLS
ncbi:MAG TPA: SMC family ATPase [Dehalococcoidia bacterium]|nr:SMC family ATPase [Dehalococcoidia bacterium]